MLVIYLSAFLRVPVSGPGWFVVAFRVVALAAAVVAAAGLFSKVVVTATGVEVRTWRRRHVPWADVSRLTGIPQWVRALRTTAGERVALPGRVTLDELALVHPGVVELMDTAGRATGWAGRLGRWARWLPGGRS